MDRRLLYAVLLATTVIILTPRLFPTPPAPPAGAAAGDSARLDTTPSRATPSPAAAGTTTAPASAPTVSPAAQAQPATAQPLAAGAAPAETTVVNTPLARYAFTSRGAAPISVQLRQYRSLRPRPGSEASAEREPVNLVRPGERMVEYRVLTAARDTVPLDAALLTPRLDTTGTQPTLTYTGTVGATPVAITYTFAPDSYLVRVSGTVGVGQSAPAFLLVDLPSGLASAEADTVDDQNNLAYAYRSPREGAASIPFAKLEPGERRLAEGPLTWVATKSKYFLVALITPNGGTPFAELHAVGGPRTSKVPTRAVGTAVSQLQNGAFNFELYTGPQEWRRLHALGRDLENANPYGGFMRGIIQPFATIMVRLLLWMRDILQLNYGWILIIFGVAVRLLLWPFNQSAMRTSLKMQRIQPQLSAVQKRYQGEPQKQQAEMMKVYKEHGMSPFSPLAGCLPMLLPMPILFALFFVFQNTIEFRGVSFFWLPDISLKDPYYIIPVVMALSMYLLSWIGQRNAPPHPQAKMLMYVMPVMMLVLFLNFPSGLNLYYAVQNLAALPQQWLIANERGKQNPPVQGAPAPARATPPKASKVDKAKRG